MSDFNKTLGKFQLVDLPPAPRGVPQIEVTFDIDANGIVHVSAKDRATSKEQSITITGQSSLSNDDISQMIKDAESHEAEDKRRKEMVEERNKAETLVYQTEKLLKDQGDKLVGDDREAVESKLADLKRELNGNDLDATRTAMEALLNANNDFTTKLYQQAAADEGGDYAAAGGSAGGATGGESSAPNDDEVVDAEIVDDEDK